MKHPFWKFQGNGNDFVIFDGMEKTPELSTEQIRLLCHRRFGIGADGLIIIKPSNVADFEMDYYNADGHIASMCGNGGRCAAAFAQRMGHVGSKMKFIAYDGLHEAIVLSVDDSTGEFYVSLSMADVSLVERNKNYYSIDTGSPHYIEIVEKAAEINVVKEGRKTRSSEQFSPDGTNVNFMEITDGRLFVRTYERGVEDETLSCGTGVTASAIAAFFETGKENFRIHTTGGDFEVDFKHDKGRFHSIWLKGPAKLVFIGEAQI